MDNWDQSKLEKVVKSKHGNPQTTTSIVCKYFLESIEDGKYGWFWECPNGGRLLKLLLVQQNICIFRVIHVLSIMYLGDKCKYQHALPPGFVLKKKKDASKAKDEISLEEFLEVEASSGQNHKSICIYL